MEKAPTCCPVECCSIRRHTAVFSKKYIYKGVWVFMNKANFGHAHFVQLFFGLIWTTSTTNVPRTCNFFRKTMVPLKEIQMGIFSKISILLSDIFLAVFTKKKTVLLEHDYMIAWLKTSYLCLSLFMVRKWIIEYWNVDKMKFL